MPQSPSASRESGARAQVSAVLITRSPGALLETCLASIPFVDEIVIVDSNSDEASLEIARRHGARIVQSNWRGFGLQKQFAVDQAAHDWVLCLDADEQISPQLRASIESALLKPVAPVYRMARRNRFMGRWLRHGEGYPDWSPRLFDRRSARWSDDPVHEKVLYALTPGTLEGDLMHDSAENLERYLEKQNRYSSLSAQQLLERGRRGRMLALVLSPLVRFFKFYVFRLGFLDGLPGFVHIVIGCAGSFVKHAKLLELERQARQK